ncbi:hypothetical protein JKF63_06940 [Porcisia hertigi]|uniref:MSP domain-containing protein n=1 Tax=Porcisia hertigi TaxID=2761500 RepID=A0A836LJE5_9TRYP|nr:hypothetical protein JKF63_06940 [Porcisia hertigi]
MNSRAPNVIINPERFELVLHTNEDCTFELTNVGYEAIIYRVRTTAPLRYYLKHSKGVIRGNSSAKITILLNRKTFAEGLPVGARYAKDTFRVECALLGEQDVVEAHGANLADLIQKKKEADAASVVQKYISCRMLLDSGSSKDKAAQLAAGADGTVGAGSAADRCGSSSRGSNSMSGHKTMTVEQMEQNTLNEKRRRSTRSKNSGDQLDVRDKRTGLLRIIITAALVVIFALWMTS